MRRIAIILAVGALMTGDLSAQVNADRQHSAWPEEQESRSKTPLSKWLPSVLPFGSQDDADTTADPSDTEPAASAPAQPPPRQQTRKRAPEPEPDPEPQLTRKEKEAEDRWWKETGDPAVSAFSRCLAEHVIDETSRGTQSSYPDFVTTAMNSRCSREFAVMAQLILDRHGQDNFARIARKLIKTKFVPAVKQVVEAGTLPEEIQPEMEKPTLEAEMRRSKEAMLGCLTEEADRLAASSAAAAERLADRVIAACQTTADDFFARLEQLYPGATGGEAGAQSAAILDASYRPAIIQRIVTVRDHGVTGGSGSGSASAKADAETVTHKRPEVYRPQTISPAGVPAPGSPAPASSQP